MNDIHLQQIATSKVCFPAIIKWFNSRDAERVEALLTMEEVTGVTWRQTSKGSERLYLVGGAGFPRGEANYPR